MKNLIWDESLNCGLCALSATCLSVYTNCGRSDGDIGAYRYEVTRRPCKTLDEAVNFVNTCVTIKSITFIIIGIKRNKFILKERDCFYTDKNNYYTFEEVFEADNKIGIED